MVDPVVALIPALLLLFLIPLLLLFRRRRESNQEREKNQVFFLLLFFPQSLGCSFLSVLRAGLPRVLRFRLFQSLGFLLIADDSVQSKREGSDFHQWFFVLFMWFRINDKKKGNRVF
jgi:hypothetical protein